MRRGCLGTRAAIAAALGLSMLAVLAHVPRAGAYVYWANTEKGTIGRAANDGSAVEAGFISGAGAPQAVTVDSSHIYWADSIGNSIGRANLDGTGVDPTFIKVGKPTDGVAVDAFHVYWSSTDGNLGRAKIDGSVREPEFVTGGSPCGVALDAGHVYWATVAFKPAGSIGRAPLGGGAPEYEYVKTPEAALLCGVAVTPSNIFWTDYGFGAGTNIGRANLNGKGVDESFVGQALAPCGLAVLGSQVYWANAGTATIGRVNTDGTGVDYGLIQTGAEPNKICGVAADSLSPPPPPPPADRTPPQTKIVKGPGGKLAKGRARFTFTSSEAGSSFECKLDGRKASRCTSPRRYAGLKPGRHIFRAWAIDAAGNRDPTPARRRFRVPG
jgi:hypothetical protein